MQHRASGLPRFVECPSSALTPTHKIDGGSAPADEGTAAHEALAIVVNGGAPDIPEIANKYGVDITTLRVLVAYGRQAWKQYGPLFTEPRTEVKVQSDRVRGTSDVIQADGMRLIVLDWKSGWVRRQHLYQLAGYGEAAVNEYGMPESGKVTVITVWLRHQEAEVKDLTADSLEQFRTMLDAAEKGIGKVWNPGEPCDYCPMWQECKARQAFSRDAVTSLTEVTGDELTADKLAELYPKAKLLEQALKVFDSALRSEVHRLGTLELPDGRSLKFTERNSETLKARQAWPVLRKIGLTDDDLESCVSMAKGKVLAAISAKADRGEKGKAKEAALENLRQADAINEKVTRILQAVKQQ